MGWNSVLEMRALVVEFHFFVCHFLQSSKTTGGVLAANGISAWR